VIYDALRTSLTVPMRSRRLALALDKFAIPRI
jgi:hypothetical protein